MASFMYYTLSSQEQLHPYATGHVCSIIPPYLLQSIVNSESVPQDARTCAERTLTHTRMLRETRASFGTGHGGHPDHSIVPPHMLQAIIDSDDASSEDKERARHNLAHSHAIREARAGGATDTAPHKRLVRVIYDSEHTDDLPGDRIRREGQVATQDVSATEVYDDFKKTFDFYYQIFKRNSIDDLGMSLIGSVHYDDLRPPPGFNNAFFNGAQMVFGDGDGIMFSSFTKSLDVIAHELTHGVTQRTADLPYHQQSGALNESISDVFGSMVKQYALNMQEAKDADWLIGAEIFMPGVQAQGLRSMKAPGTAYDDPRFGKDEQPSHMRDYKELPDDDDPFNDFGGVHVNSGIPNHAFFLVATALGGHSWDRAGPIWYDTLMDPNLRQFTSQKENWGSCFRFFADLSCAHAAQYGGNVQDVVIKAWRDVGVYPGNEPTGGGHGPEDL